MSQVVNLRLIGPEWAPLHAYAESQGITATQAARELLMTSLATNAVDAVYIATARTARHEIAKIAYAAGARAMRAAWEEIRAKAVTLGMSVEDL